MQVLRGARIREFAEEAGFDLCGFAKAEPIPAETLFSWLDAGMSADMKWMANRAAERLDVARLLSGAKTVVALACNYYFPDPSDGSAIARYARGRDYHATLKERLRKLRESLSREYPDLRSYGCVDTGPVMEKVWAARAGLGYVGRNGCFITEEFGSYVLLAALVVDAAVDQWALGPALDRCGTCNLCVSACPTDAITHGHGFEIATFNATNLIYRKEQMLAAMPAHIGANAIFNQADVAGGAPALPVPGS